MKARVISEPKATFVVHLRFLVGDWSGRGPFGDSVFIVTAAEAQDIWHAALNADMGATVSVMNGDGAISFVIIIIIVTCDIDRPLWVCSWFGFVTDRIRKSKMSAYTYLGE